MTENEVFEHISNLAGDYKCFDEKISHQESLILCNLIEEIQQYRAIGTVEEFRILKELKNEHRKIGNIEGYNKGYAKAIDEFAEKLKKLYQAYDIDLCLQDNDHLSCTDSRIALESYIDEIAEQLKGE